MGLPGVSPFGRIDRTKIARELFRRRLDVGQLRAGEWRTVASITAGRRPRIVWCCRRCGMVWHLTPIHRLIVVDDDLRDLAPALHCNADKGGCGALVWARLSGWA